MRQAAGVLINNKHRASNDEAAGLNAYINKDEELKAAMVATNLPV